MDHGTKCYSDKQHISNSETKFVQSRIKELTGEEESNTAISRLIDQISLLVDRNDPLIKSIKFPKLLVRGLLELQNLVEMVDIKHSIVNQIKFLLTNQARKNTITNNDKTGKFEGHMLHSVISGNPGTGKTTVGYILARIWLALGFVKRKTDIISSPTSSTGPSENTIAAYRNRVAELERSQYSDHQQLYHLRGIIPQCKTVATEIRHRVINLKPGPRPSSIVDPDKEWDILLAYTHALRCELDNIADDLDKDSSDIPNIPNINIINEIDEDPKFIVAAREDLIAEYTGQTAPKTKKVLESARGGVLFIDEAYSICGNDSISRDRYGEECINTINEFMSLYPDEIIIIFAGYKDKLFNTIFKVQPGLKRRITYFFEIKDYSTRGLAKIFERQLAKHSWILNSDIDLDKIFSLNKDIIQGNGGGGNGGGGSTEKLTLFVKIEYSNAKFEETMAQNDVVHDSIITENMLIKALDNMRSQAGNIVDNIPYPQMYT